VLYLISSQEATPKTNIPGVSWRVVSYDEKKDLVEALHGIHTVLSFVNEPMADLKTSSQRKLIDACVSAGVRRFAPSEYGR
jgi:uncharacterized protein YbjT (DUF2867 family)